MNFARARARMVEEQLVDRGVSDLRVLAVMSEVERHRFVAEALQQRAYDDKALPIGERQTISQPYMVGLMTQILELRGGERVLEIGTGCGYQTAVLAELAATVYTIERLAPLAAAARATLAACGYANVVTRVGDGTIGWAEEAPFDRILITAGTPQVPRPLVTQLREGGSLVFPVGEEQLQTLVRIRKEAEGLREEYFGDCRFVKLVGRYGWRE
ncbi:MAG: protein-L-isoaspartate(D-aspartate) O-methyltransferase [Deltaproteobacteria bacterium]|nr:protein-L-isoaspartate(D-aspartate) O-methyltransferase [Deltaproteobacteria bacterium]